MACSEAWAVSWSSRLSDLAEKGEAEFSRAGEGGDEKKGVKAVYGFSVRVGSGGKPHIERFGNIQEGGPGKGPIVEEVREPIVDQFDEGEHLLVAGGAAGVEANDIHFEVKEDVLNLSATHGTASTARSCCSPRQSARRGPPRPATMESSK